MRAHLAVLVALLLALPCVPAPNVPYDPNTTYLSALSVPLSTSSQEQPDVEFSLTQNGIQYLYFDLPVLTAVTSVAIRVKFSGAKEIHVVAQQGAFSSHCDKPLLPSTSPYSCYSTKMTANTSSSEGTLTLTYPQVDRYFVTVILDSTAEGSGPAQFKVRTTVSACPGSKAGPNCAFPVMSLSEPMDPAVTGYVPANQYKFYVWNQPVSGTFVLHLEAALCADATDTILLFRALNFPSLETSPMFPYYDLSLTCGDAPSELSLTAPVGGAYWMAVYGGSKGANFTFGFQASPCGQDVAGSGCADGEWFPIGQNQGPWCTAAGSSACQEPDTALPWDHALGSSFSLIPPGWNYFTLPELQAPAYTLKVAVTPASRAIPFTLVLIRNNIPVVLPQYTSLPQSAWVYYNTSDAQGSAITTLTVPYPAAGIWMVGILADPNTFGNESIDFSISASHYSCFHNCSTTSGAQLGTCDLTTTQCHCHSGRLGADCSGKAKSNSHAGAIVGAIFGVLGGVVLIGLGVWYFFMRPKNSYEMI